MDDVNSNDNNRKQVRHADEKKCFKKITKHKTMNLFPMKKNSKCKESIFIPIE